jgi:hypothetical protein
MRRVLKIASIGITALVVLYVVFLLVCGPLVARCEAAPEGSPAISPRTHGGWDCFFPTHYIFGFPASNP